MIDPVGPQISGQIKLEMNRKKVIDVQIKGRIGLKLNQKS